ncbi:serine hydrolase domain-containing protein [Planctobacterium marinum]|uniref:serine hydrolase domain-containing protein n=1 Tax=Planctobacterium marinum TaxID=1631968 RepID=UPI0030C6F664
MVSGLTFFSLVACNGKGEVDLESFVQAEITSFLNEEKAQVASIAIVSNGKIYQNHFGKLGDGVSPNNQTVYELASITKTYTGLVLAKAVQDKKVELDGDIRAYLGNHEYKNLERFGKYITLRHLATHTSGLPKDFAYSEDDAQKGQIIERLSAYSKEKFFHDLSRFKLESVPGENFQYSNAGTKLTAYILESVYNKPFDSLINEFIKAKSGEQNTSFQRSHQGLDNVTTGRNHRGEAMPLLSPYSWAEGGLTSTTESMTHYLLYQLTSENPEVALSHNLLAGDSSNHGTAFFWNTYKYDSEAQMLYHSGGSLGTSSWLAIYPEKHIGVFIVANVSTRDSQGKLNEISNKIVDKIGEM